jgi:hypothetical protein
MMIVKRTDSTGNWCVYHRSLNVNGDNAPETDFMYLDSTQVASDSDQLWDDTAPTATEFTLHGNAQVNASGGSYVAYLFANNDGDGDFGPTGDQDIIKCGSFTTDSSGIASVDLGWEPQFLIIKRSSGSGYWLMLDNMRGLTNNVTGGDKYLSANRSDAEVATNLVDISATGFETLTGNWSTNSDYIYIAIRRGPTGIPESASEVFDIGYRNQDGDGVSPGFTSGWPVDMALRRPVNLTRGTEAVSRLNSGKYLLTSSTASEATTAEFVFDYQDGWFDLGSTNTNDYSWMWRRAPSFFDVVAYTGDGTSSHTISHNLGVAPEMIWIKRRNATANWAVDHTGLGSNNYILLNSGAAQTTPEIISNYTATSFDLINSSALINGSGDTYIAYLFASLDGVSKVGSYTGNGTSQTIDCGFSSGARFVLIKQADGTADWALFDTERGIVAGDDVLLRLNKTDAQSTTLGDIIDPHNSGFIVNAAGGTMTNNNGSTYIFYAIA